MICGTNTFRLTFCRICILLALSLFLMSVNIKTPVVVENITLMCLRILQKLIKPPAPTSKKNKANKTLSFIYCSCGFGSGTCVMLCTRI